MHEQVPTNAVCQRSHAWASVLWSLATLAALATAGCAVDPASAPTGDPEDTAEATDGILWANELRHGGFEGDDWWRYWLVPGANRLRASAKTGYWGMNIAAYGTSSTSWIRQTVPRVLTGWNYQLSAWTRRTSSACPTTLRSAGVSMLFLGPTGAILRSATAYPNLSDREWHSPVTVASAPYGATSIRVSVWVYGPCAIDVDGVDLR